MALAPRLRLPLPLPPVPSRPRHHLLQSSPYISVRPKWRKDPFYDSVPLLCHHPRDLRRLLALCSLLPLTPSASPSLPASRLPLPLPGHLLPHSRLSVLLRRFPSLFLESRSPPPLHLPLFRLSPAASSLLSGHSRALRLHLPSLLLRLRRLVLMSPRRLLPLRIALAMRWHLALPADLAANLPAYSRLAGLEPVPLSDGSTALRPASLPASPPLSALQLAALRTGAPLLPPRCPLPFPLYPSKGARPKRKLAEWLEGFQRLPYVSPYEDASDLDPGSDIAEKRAVGVLHELLSMFVGHAAERRAILCLREHLGLPQKFHRVFERHPGMFYLHLKCKTCIVVLKEGYHGGLESAIERHPMTDAREEFVKLVEESREILQRRRLTGVGRRKEVLVEEGFCLDGSSECGGE